MISSTISRISLGVSAYGFEILSWLPSPICLRYEAMVVSSIPGNFLSMFVFYLSMTRSFVILFFLLCKCMWYGIVASGLFLKIPSFT